MSRIKRMPKRSLSWTLPFVLSLSPLLTVSSMSAAIGAPAVNVPIAPVTTPVHIVSPSPSAHSHQATNLDLSSITASISSRNSNPVNIIIGGSIAHGTVSGGTSMTILPGQLVTAAQYAAVYEALAGNQTLLLNAQGAAVGGALNLNSRYVSNLTGLVVPKNVAVDAIGFNSATPLNVSGGVRDFGSIYALQTSAGVGSVLNLGSLLVGSGAVFSTNLPSAGNTTGLYASNGLTVNLNGSLTNHGTISSSGALTVSAGGSINNVSTASSAASISASNINLLTGSGSLVNSGLIQSAGNLNLNTLAQGTTLTVQNFGGTLQAGGANGSIKFRSGGAGEESANAGVWGGVLSAADINMYGKDMVAAVSQIDGTINNYGSAAHVFVNSGSLNVGNQVLSGDPNYYNNGGNVNLTSSSYTDAGSIAVVASGSITTASAVSIDPSASGSSVSLIAGYNFNVASPNNSAVNWAAGGGGSTLTFTGTSNSGQSINSAGNALSVTTTGNGAVTIASTGATNMGSGTISAVSGNVSVIAGGGFSSTGLISTQNGSISIASANPVIASNTTVTNGVLSAQPSVGALATGGISTAGLIANANISLQGKGSIEVFNGIETSNPGTIDIGSGGSFIKISGGSTTIGNPTTTSAQPVLEVNNNGITLLGPTTVSATPSKTPFVQNAVNQDSTSNPNLVLQTQTQPVTNNELQTSGTTINISASSLQNNGIILFFGPLSTNALIVNTLTNQANQAVICYSNIAKVIAMADSDSNSDLMATPIVWSPLNGNEVGNSIKILPGLLGTQSTSSNNDMIANSTLEPISFIELVPTPAINLSLRSKKTATALIETTGDTEAFIDKNNNSIILEHGEILVSATTDTKVKANGHMVNLRPGTVATLSLHSDILRITSLYEQSSHSTKVFAGKVQHSLASGEELIITPSGLASKVASSDTIGRRRAERKDLNGNCFISSEYSFITAVKNSNILRLVMKGSDKDNRILTDRMKKMAVCLNQVTAGHGSFGPLK